MTQVLASVATLRIASCASEPVESGARELPFDGAVVALQDQSVVGFLAPDGTLAETLDLVTDQAGTPLGWMIHNVQITPDGMLALATAMPAMDQGDLSVRDQLVIVDLEDRTVAARCELDDRLS